MDVRSIEAVPPVVEHNGTLEGTTVTWTPKAGENLVMKAKAKATGGEAGVLGLSSSSSSTPLLIGLVIAALLLVGGLVALLLRRGRTPAAAGAAETAAGRRLVHALDVPSLDLDPDATPAILGIRCFSHGLARGILTGTANRD